MLIVGIPLLKDFIGWLLYTFLEQLTGCLKEPVAMCLKEQIPRTCTVVVLRFASNKSQSLPGWSFPEQLSPWPSPLYHAWNSQRKGGALQTTMSPLLPWSGGFYCQEIPLFRDFIVRILEPALSQPQLHPHPLPANEFKALWKWKVALLHKKKIGGDKVINTYFVRESIRATILEHSFGLLEG